MKFCSNRLYKNKRQIRSIWLEAKRLREKKFVVCARCENTHSKNLLWKSATWYFTPMLPTSNEIIFAELQILYMLLYSIIHVESNVYVSSFVALCFTEKRTLFNLKSAEENFHFSVSMWWKFFIFPWYVFLYRFYYVRRHDSNARLLTI